MKDLWKNNKYFRYGVIVVGACIVLGFLASVGGVTG